MAEVYKSMIPLPLVTRVEVIDENGRSYIKRLDNDQTVCSSIQDDGRTLKVFIDKIKEDQAGVDPNEPGTTPLTRVVRKIFNAFKLGPLDHSVSVGSMADDYPHSPLGIPIPYRKVKDNSKPPKKGGFNRKGNLKE